MFIERCKRYVRETFLHKYTFDEIPPYVWDSVFWKWSNPTEWNETYWVTCSLCRFVKNRCTKCPLESSGYCTGDATTSMLHIIYGRKQFEDAVPGWHKRWVHRVNDFLQLIYPYTTAGRKHKQIPRNTENAENTDS